MIVDLLRNDIGRLAGWAGEGARAVRDGAYATVHQMTSTIEGRLAEPPDAAGADGGAVSLRVGHRGAENPGDGDHPRGGARIRAGVYCGAVGWMAPDGRPISRWRSARCRSGATGS
jgi:para-aminobenzoate synthetase component I